MQITLYKNFSKRRNSTKQPTGGTTAEVYLKENTSIENPTFLIDGIDTSVNYVSAFGNYYYVSDITLGNNNIYEISCTKDALATHKGAIGSYSAYIERCSSTYDEMIADEYLSTTQELLSSEYAFTSIDGIPAIGDGCYLFKTMARNGLNIYGTSDLDVLTGLFTESTYGFDDFHSMVQSLGLMQMNPSEYIVSCLWVPFSLNQFAGTSEGVAIGFWELGSVTAKKISTRYMERYGKINLPENPYDDFRKYDSRFSRYNLYLPGVGSVNLDAVDLNDDLYYYMAFDIFTGAVQYTISRRNALNVIIATYDGQLGCPIELSSSHTNINSLVETSLGTIASVGANLLSDNPVGAFTSAFGGAVSVANTFTSPVSSIHGTAGNIARIQAHKQIIVNLSNLESKDFPVSQLGRPLHEVKTISSLSGYIKCAGASVSVAGKASDSETINSYLNSGFYYE